MSVTLFGIPNCDQVKKAKIWLNEHQITFDFHDFKKSGITAPVINGWLEHLDWDTLLNRRGTTWRNFSETEKLAATDADGAIQCMINSPSVIKRPVLAIQAKKLNLVITGFSEENYQHLLDLKPFK